MEQAINTFEGGINKDFHKLTIPATQATHIENMRITTDTGSTTKSLINVEGTSHMIDFPDLSDVYKVTSTSQSIITVQYSFNINGTLIIFNSTSDTEDLALDFNAAATSNPTLNSLGITGISDKDGNSMLIYSNNGQTFTCIMVTSPALSTINISQILLYRTKANITIIGSFPIRDYIYLITTTDSSSTGGSGQIWRYSYDTTGPTTTSTLTLLYDNNINLTTQHPIFPPAITGVYENVETIRLYWTDNFNKLRSFNVADSTNGFALDPSLLDIEPPVDNDQAVLQKITSDGNNALYVGTYEATYRLKNSSGVTKFGPLSNIVSIVPLDEASFTGSNYTSYVGGGVGTKTNKNIHWKISGLDTDFERIEILIIYRSALNGTPIIYKTHDEELPANGVYEFTYSGQEFIEELTINDFLEDRFAFTHCKTIAAKDMHLVVGNVRNEKTDFTYDARAYIHMKVGPVWDFIIRDSQGNSTSWLANYGADYNNISEDHDAIAPFNDSLTNGISSSTGYYAYNPDTGFLGGKGANITYEFGTEYVRADITNNIGSQQTAPFRHTNPNFYTYTYNNGAGKEYNFNMAPDGVKSAYHSSVLKGYQRNEIYRFAIVFYDKQGRSLFAKWIGDIKMPDYCDVLDPNNKGICDDGSNPPNDFRLSFSSGDYGGYSDGSYLSILYIKFNISIPQNILQYISGFQIVRCERTDADKTIIGSGLMIATAADSGTYYTHDTSTWITGALNNNTPEKIQTIQSPEFQFGLFPGFASGDKILTKQRITHSNTQLYTDLAGTATDYYYMWKFSKSEPLTNVGGTAQEQLIVTEAGVVGFGGAHTFNQSPNTGINFRNHSEPNGSSEYEGIGASTLLIGLNATFDYTFNGVTQANNRKYYVNYYRQRASQYGGNSYSQRSNSVYIACGDFQPVLSNITTTTSYTHKVFGGDIFTVYYDNEKIVKNWGTQVPGLPAAPSGSQSATFYFPCETTFNTELRQQSHTNRDLTTEGTGASAREDYEYNKVYSNERNVVKFFPKPVDFRSVDEYDSRFWISQKKIAGESKDSWAIFLTNDWQDGQSEYGPVNSLLMFNNELWFWQDKAYGILPINRKTILDDNSTTGSAPVLLGTGQLIDIPRYLSTRVGCKQQGAIVASPNSIAFFDILSRTMYKVGSNGEQPISDIKGLQSYFPVNLTGKIQIKDNPIYFDSTLNNSRCGITCVYDYRYNEFIFTFIDAKYNSTTTQYAENKFTVAFNEQTDQFGSFYTYYPSLYISDTKNFFAADPNVSYKLYIHNSRSNFCKWYGATIADPSKLSIVINKNPDYAKIFENLEWFMETRDITLNLYSINETWSSIRCYTDVQNSNFITLSLSSNLRRKERKWQIAVPRNAVNSQALVTTGLDIFDATNLTTGATRLFRDKMRNNYMTVDFVYNNTFPTRNQISIPYIKTYYQISPR